MPCGSKCSDVMPSSRLTSLDGSAEATCCSVNVVQLTSLQVHVRQVFGVLAPVESVQQATIVIIFLLFQPPYPRVTPRSPSIGLKPWRPKQPKLTLLILPPLFKQHSVLPRFLQSRHLSVRPSLRRCSIPRIPPNYGTSSNNSCMPACERATTSPLSYAWRN